MTDDARDSETVEIDPAGIDVQDDATEQIKSSRRLRRLRRLPRLPRTPRLPGVRHALNSKFVPPILIALMVITGGAASWIYFKQCRPDQQTDSSVKQTVVSAASDATVAVLSYAPDTLDQDFANAKSHLTGDFLTYYNQFTEQVVGPAAKEKSLKTAAHVTGAAVSELHPDSAVVLLFVDQTTTTKDSNQPSLAVSSIVVNLTLINGNWLINKFTPV